MMYYTLKQAPNAYKFEYRVPPSITAVDAINGPPHLFHRFILNLFFAASGPHLREVSLFIPKCDRMIFEALVRFLKTEGASNLRRLSVESETWDGWLGLSAALNTSLPFGETETKT